MKQFLTSIRILLFMTILTGIVYPLLVTGIGQALFSKKANGGILDRSQVALGADLIGQKFESERYFWPRPSAVDYNSAGSGGSNQGQASADLKKAYDDRVTKLKAAHPDQSSGEPPQDLLFASSSGLDPHISPEAAIYQVTRVAQFRKMDPNAVRALVEEASEGRQFGLLGEPRVNVLELNLSLDRAQGIVAAPTPTPTPEPSPASGSDSGGY